MYVNKENWTDAQKYYENTLIKVVDPENKFDSDKTVWYVEKVDPQFMLLKDVNSTQKVLIDLDKGYNLEYLIPGKAIFQKGEAAIALSRLPKRMWKKGMTSENTQFAILTSVGWKPIAFESSYVFGFVNKPGYYTINDALKGFKNDDLTSAAITPRIALSAKGALYCDSVVIGKHFPQENMFKVKKLFVPDIQLLTQYKVEAL
jgi:hypothetical protein